jgi:NAD(P)H-nitrite reductase large subunit
MNKQNSQTKTSLTLLLPGGIIPKSLFNRINELSEMFSFERYITTAQNLRILDIEQNDLEEIKLKLAECGAVFKEPGKFPLPKLCVGKKNCKLGLVNTFELSEKIIERFGHLTRVKPKFKIAISGCPASCSGSKLSDIGIIATRGGLEIYVGGKGGPLPKTGKRIAKNKNQDELLPIIEQLIEYHDRKTNKKQRFYKLIKENDFPYELPPSP